MELMPVIVYGIGFVAMAVLIVWSNGYASRRSAAAFEAFARRHGHDWDESTGRVVGHGFVAQMRTQNEFGRRRDVPVMTFAGHFALPESELRCRLWLGFTHTVHRLSGLQPLVRHDEAFRHRTHDLWSTHPAFLEDAWARGIQDILAAPTQPLSYRITPEGRLEVYCLKGVLPAWNEQALAEAVAAGERLSALFDSMARR